MDTYDQKRIQDFHERWTQKPPRASLEEVTYCSVDLGCGGYGAVSLVRWGGDVHAMKAISKAELNERRRSRILRECRLLHALSHPCIVPLTFTAQTPDHAYIGMEPARCDLQALLDAKGPLSEPDCRFYAAQIAMALDYVHLLGWLHRDLKPANCLVMADGYLKLTDFGLARHGAAAVESGSCGTGAYIAPDVASGGAHSTAMDVWSLGVTLFVMVNDAMPRYRRRRTVGDEYDFTICYRKKLSDTFKEVMATMLHVKPNKRATCRDILGSEWFSEIDIDKLFYKEVQAPYIM